MDYKDDGNGEGLFGARNENSVLFSLDSLTALDKSSSDNSAGSGSTSSGDASGLIDLSTLANMSSSGNNDSLADGEPVMESMVFNQVVHKKSKTRIIIISILFVLVIAGAVSAILYFNHVSNEAIKAKEQEQANLEAEKQKEAETADAKIKALEQKIKEAEADAKRREANQADIENEMKKLEEQKAALLANGGTEAADSKNSKKSDKKSDSKTDSKADSGTAAPSPAPSAKKAPDKSQLIAALKAANTKAQKCGKGGNLTVQFNLANNTAKSVKATGGSFAGSATEKCILTVVQKHNWPDGTASGIKYTFKF